MYSEHEIIWNLLCDDHSSAWPFAKVLIDPPHVVQQLANRLVPPPPNLELDNNKASFVVDGEEINEAILHGKLDAGLVSTGIEVKTRLDACRILSQKVAKI